MRSQKNPQEGLPPVQKREWRDEDVIRRKYVVEDKSGAEIAEEYGITKGPIHRQIRYFNLDKESNYTQSGLHNINSMRFSFKEETFLQSLHYERRISTFRIAQQADCERYIVGGWLSFHNMEVIDGKISENIEVDANRAKCLYNKGEEIVDIAEKLEADCYSVFQALQSPYQEIRESDLLRKPLRYHDSPNRNGYKYYGANWEEKRKLAIQRENEKCFSCGLNRSLHYEKWGEDLHVHHIIPIRRFDEEAKANHLDNLVTLCRDCHSQQEGKKFVNIVKRTPVSEQLNPTNAPT